MSDWANANPTANPTIIDGQGKYRGVMVLGIIAPTSLDLEGLTIQNGMGGGIPARGGSAALAGFGGGAFIDMGAEQNAGLTQVFRNDVFVDNIAIGTTAPLGSFGSGGDAGGGGVSDFAGTLVLDTVTFNGNQAAGGSAYNQGGAANGGGLYASSDAAVSGDNVTLASNAANGGAGGHQTGSTDFEGGPGEAAGGAAALFGGSTMTLANTTATANQATGGDGGLFAGSGTGGAFSADQSTLSISDATIDNNTATAGVGYAGARGAAQGGGVASISANLTLNRVTVQGNTVVTTTNGGNYGGGGGLFASGNANRAPMNSLFQLAPAAAFIFKTFRERLRNRPSPTTRSGLASIPVRGYLLAWSRSQCRPIYP